MAIIAWFILCACIALVGMNSRDSFALDFGLFLVIITCLGMIGFLLVL